MWINWISDATIWQLQKPVLGVWSCAGTRCCSSPFRLPHLLCEPSSIVLPVGIPVIRFQSMELTWRFDCVPEVCDDRSGCGTSKLGILHGWWDKEEKARGWAVEMLLIRGLEFASSFHLWPPTPWHRYCKMCNAAATAQMFQCTKDAQELLIARLLHLLWVVDQVNMTESKIRHQNHQISIWRCLM